MTDYQYRDDCQWLGCEHLETYEEHHGFMHGPAEVFHTCWNEENGFPCIFEDEKED